MSESSDASRDGTKAGFLAIRISLDLLQMIAIRQNRNMLTKCGAKCQLFGAVVEYAFERGGENFEAIFGANFFNAAAAHFRAQRMAGEQTIESLREAGDVTRLDEETVCAVFD